MVKSKMADDHRTDLPGKSLHSVLKAKSRRRREELAELAANSLAPRRIRNDLMPKLELVERAPGDLGFPARKLRKVEPAHVLEVANAISSLGFCDPVLIDEQNGVLDGIVRVEAAKLLGLPHIPCIRANHLSASERRLVRMALNRLGEKGSWHFDELKLELEELILEDVPIEITGFSMLEVDQIIAGEEPAAVEAGPLAPELDARPVAQFGDMFAMGKHRILCGDSTNPVGLELLMSDGEARLILTDQPYNVPIAGHVTSEVHREFLMGSGEMTDAEFQAFNAAWIGASLRYLRDGALLGAFIDWRCFRSSLPPPSSWASPRSISSSGPRPMPAWAASTARNTNFCRYSRKARRRTSTTSSSARTVAGARMSGPIPAPPAWAPNLDKGFNITPPSSPLPCWKTHCSI